MVKNRLRQANDSYTEESGFKNASEMNASAKISTRFVKQNVVVVTIDTDFENVKSILETLAEACEKGYTV